MRRLKSSMLWRAILFITAFVMTVSLTACESSSNTESSNKYKVEVQTQTDDFYVNDFANLFSETDKQVMMANAVELAEDYDGIQVVVTTVNSLNGNEIEEYAYSMYEQYGIGKDSMGILILLSVEDREVKIETGKTMQAYITDSKSGQLLDKYGMDYFRENKFDEGLKAVQEAVIAEIKNIVPIDWNKDQSTDASQNKNKMEVLDMVFATLFIIALVIIGVLVNAYRKMKSNLSETTEKNAQLSNQVKGLRNDVSRVTDQNAQLSGKVENLNRKLTQTYSNHDKTIQSMRSQHEQTCRELNDRISDITQKNVDLNKQIAETQEFYGRVRKLHPECDFEKEVENMIKTEFRNAVSSVDNQINAVINIPADKDKIEIFRNVINMYEDAEDDIKNAVTADIGKVRDLYQESINLQKRAEAIVTAAKIDKMFNSILDMVADKDSVEIFKNALKDYEGANSLSKEFVKADIEKVRSLYQESVRLRKAFEKEQQELRDKAEAKKVFERMDKVYRNNPNGEYDEYDNLYEAYLLYEGLTDNQKAFFPNTDMLRRYETLMRKAKEAKRNYDVAHKAEEEAKSCIRSICGSADEDDRDKIARAFRHYNALSSAQKVYFSSELLNKMKRFKREAEDDHERQERRREERRRSSYSNSFSHNHSSSFKSGSHHSGFGGHSSGGGASRRF